MPEPLVDVGKQLVVALDGVATIRENGRALDGIERSDEPARGYHTEAEHVGRESLDPAHRLAQQGAETLRSDAYKIFWGECSQPGCPFEIFAHPSPQPCRHESTHLEAIELERQEL